MIKEFCPEVQNSVFGIRNSQLTKPEVARQKIIIQRSSRCSRSLLSYSDRDEDGYVDSGGGGGGSISHESSKWLPVSDHHHSLADLTKEEKEEEEEG